MLIKRVPKRSTLINHTTGLRRFRPAASPGKPLLQLPVEPKAMPLRAVRLGEDAKALLARHWDEIFRR